jgi:hypothetical protein
VRNVRPEPSTAELLAAEKLTKLKRENRIAEGELIRRAEVLKRLRRMERALLHELKIFYVDAGTDFVTKHIAELIDDLTQRD